MSATIAQFVTEVVMHAPTNAISILKNELEFLDRGGYRQTVGSRQPAFCMETSTEWRPALFFEDSPSCPKKRYEHCFPERDCLLTDFVPEEHKNDEVPCRHIPLNETGETIASMSRGGASETKIEAALRSWLVKTIANAEAEALSSSSI